jgi:dihydroflavonol-4-reductase
MSSAGTVLVTGATGFVGSVLTRQLVDEGRDVRVFRRDTSSLNLLGVYAERVDHAVGDVTRARSLYEAMQGVERVYHVAAKVSFAPGEQEALRHVNADGTANVVNAALRAGVRRLVHTSSMAAFGRPEEPGSAIDETTEWQGAPHRSAYARSKRRAELEVHRGIAEGLDATLVNPSLVFGVGGPDTNTRRIVDAVRSGWLPAVPPGGTNVVDVRDVAAGLRVAMEHGDTGRRYFLGGENLSWKSLTGTLAEAFGVDPHRHAGGGVRRRSAAPHRAGVAFDRGGRGGRGPEPHHSHPPIPNPLHGPHGVPHLSLRQHAGSSGARLHVSFVRENCLSYCRRTEW